MFPTIRASSFRTLTVLTFVALAALAPAAHAQAIASAEDVADMVTPVRQALVPYADFNAAKSAGWDTAITECLATDAGGMGFHYANTALIDDSAQLDMLRPEALLYEPQADGAMELVGAEYIIPGSAWTSDEPPRLFDRPFQFVEKFGVWGLHLWLRDNPSGTFAPWNPTVSCDAAS